MTAPDPTGELREQIEATLFRSGADNYDMAVDLLLSGPLAPLLAKLKAVEDLDLLSYVSDEESASEHAGGWNHAIRLADRLIRRALDAS